MITLSTTHPEVQKLAQYLQNSPHRAKEVAISYQQKYLVILSEYQKLQAEYLALKAQRKSPSVSPVSAFVLSLIASVRITKFSLIGRSQK